MLVIKIDIEKSKENYQKIIDLLADYDISSAAWETNRPGSTRPAGDDLGSRLSQAIDKVRPES